MEYYIGIDIGTTNLKSALFTEDGKLKSYHAEPTPIIHPQEGWSEFSPAELWKTICICLKNVTAEVNADDICSVGVSSMGEAGMLTDDKGIPLTNIIAWYDPRAKEQN